MQNNLQLYHIFLRKLRQWHPFGHADLLRWLDARAWHYVLRLPGQEWLPVSALPIQEGETHSVERCFRLGKPPRLHFRPYL